MPNNNTIAIPMQWCNFLYDHPEFVNNKMTLKASHNQLLKQVNIAPKQPLSLMKQSFNVEDPYINIPDEIAQQYQSYRPTPLKRAFNLEKKLNCNAHIYYKYEGANASGSHKLNTAIAQVYYYKKAGAKHIVTGTGAGQWGTAIAYACQMFKLKCTVFMVNISLNQKPQRRELMELLGATIHSSPSNLTTVGRKTLSENNNYPGSLAVATAEAIEIAGKEPYTQFSVGSGENCVLLHQTIIGQEALEQLQSFNVFPDQIIASMGAGSNFGGITLPFYRYAKLHKKNCLLIAVEPYACPKLTRGKYAFEINDFSGSTPISEMYTLGRKFIAPDIHAGGLRYHGTSEFLSAMYYNKLITAQAIGQIESLRAGLTFFEAEGILPAPESAHAISVGINNAKKHPKNKDPLIILINISGNGYFDLSAYSSYKKGIIDDGFPDEIKLKASLDSLEII